MAMAQRIAHLPTDTSAIKGNPPNQSDARDKFHVPFPPQPGSSWHCERAGQARHKHFQEISEPWFEIERSFLSGICDLRNGMLQENLFRRSSFACGLGDGDHRGSCSSSGKNGCSSRAPRRFFSAVFTWIFILDVE